MIERSRVRIPAGAAGELHAHGAQTHKRYGLPEAALHRWDAAQWRDISMIMVSRNTYER